MLGLNLLALFVVMLVIGLLLWVFGPQGFRTYLQGIIIAIVPLLGELLDYLSSGQVNWRAILNGDVATIILVVIGVLIVIYNYGNKKLYGKEPQR